MVTTDRRECSTLQGLGNLPDCGSGPMYRVVAINLKGSMSEIWLPKTVEGLYSFDPDDRGYQVPVIIKARGNQWIAAAGEGTNFYLDEQRTAKEIEIQDQLLIEFRSEAEEYVLFAEAEAQDTKSFQPYQLDRLNRISIGRSQNSDISYDSPWVSDTHAFLIRENGTWTIVDHGSDNGVFVNGVTVKRSILRPGDGIYIMGLQIVMGVECLAIRKDSGRIRVNSRSLLPIMHPQDVLYSPVPPTEKETSVCRSPRRRVLLEPETIEVEAPPNSMSNQMPLLLRMGSPLITGGRALFTGNIFSAVTSLLMPLLTQGYTEKDRQDYEQKRRTMYRAYIEKKKAEILEENRREQQVLAEAYPPIADTLDFPTGGGRLWERQQRDDDFLTVRIGNGKIPMLADLQYPKRRLDLEQDDLEEEMYRLVENTPLVGPAPVLIPLREQFVCGIMGPTKSAMMLMRSIIAQIAMTHSYDEVKMVLLADEYCLKKLDFVRYLPHFWNNEKTERYIARTRSDAQQLSKVLTGCYDRYTKGRAGNRNVLKSEPAIVVFAQSAELYESVEVLKEIVGREEYCGFVVITTFSPPPKETMALVSLEADNRYYNLKKPEKEGQSFTPDPYPAAKAAQQLRALMNCKLRLESQQNQLPESISFLDLYHAGKVEYLNPLKRWAENNPIKSLSAPIGIGTDGKPFCLDLHEKKQGPHGLIAGGTGSGKSEFIITYLLSMAVNYSPDEVAFVLIDYKGGGLADAFVDKRKGIHLPHVVGVITNLDGAEIRRSLLSINSELKRRQRLFSEAKSLTGEGTMDIYDYQRLFRQKRVSEPLPHLFIVADEFAELKKQQPEFMDELISTARIGRSLGVHLILATQKPTGVVNDQIWSNTRFRVCLKVAEKSDSMEMLKRPEAAELKNVGRFYLQVGYNELFALGQSAWCGAPYLEQEELAPEKDTAIQFLDTTGQVILTKKTEKKKTQSGKKQIVAIVQYLSELATRENIVPRQLWKDSLPEKMDVTDAPLAINAADEPYAVLGITDDPERQQQQPLYLALRRFHHALVVGPSGSGKTTMLRSMLWSLVSRYDPKMVQYYLVDLSGGGLSPFQNMPHCGAYLTIDNEAEYGRLLSFLREMAQDRRKTFQEAEVTGFDSYLQIASMPLILVIVDGYQKIFSDFQNGPMYAANIHTLLTELANCGIRFILSVNHSNECSTKAKQEIDYRLIFNPKDRYDAGEILSAKVSYVPPVLPGRGLCLQEGRPLEFHAATYRADKAEKEAVSDLKTELSDLASRYGMQNMASRLPMVSREETYEEFCRKFAPERIPLGYSVHEMQPIALPLQQFTNLSVFFGNPDGVRPALSAFLYAAYRNGMETIVVKRQEDSNFDTLNNLLKDYPGAASVLSCTKQDLDDLAQRLNRMVVERTELVNRHTDSIGIPRQEKGRAKKSAVYVRQHSKPLLVLFESFGDVARAEKTDLTEATLRAYLGGMKGYNIYYIGCLYASPADSGLRMNEHLQRFVQSGTAMLFGGRYAQQTMTSSLPTEYKRMDKPLADYEKGLLLYREAWHEIHMPLGPLATPDVEPDEEAII